MSDKKCTCEIDLDEKIRNKFLDLYSSCIKSERERIKILQDNVSDLQSKLELIIGMLGKSISSSRG